MDKIAEIDRYVAGLCRAWKGECFLISDHGLHATPDGGDHGERGEGAAGGILGTKNSGEAGKAAKEDRTVIFGWGGDTFDGRMDMKDFLEMLALGYDTKQAVFYGSDEFACACSDGEIRKGGNVFLARQRPGTAGEESWRLVVAEETYNRRWCKDVVRIELRRT